jgi:hypothetical protein
MEMMRELGNNPIAEDSNEKCAAVKGIEEKLAGLKVELAEAIAGHEGELETYLVEKTFGDRIAALNGRLAMMLHSIASEVKIVIIISCCIMFQ